MDVAARKKIVENLLNKAHEATGEQVKIILAEKNPDFDFVYYHLKQYILSKFLLAPDEQEDDIKALATLSVARTLKFDPNAVHALDTATPCDHATSESTKKVLLLYAIQKDLQLPPNPEEFSKPTSVYGLAGYVLKALQLKAAAN